MTQRLSITHLSIVLISKVKWSSSTKNNKNRRWTKIDKIQKRRIHHRTDIDRIQCSSVQSNAFQITREIAKTTLQTSPLKQAPSIHRFRPWCISWLPEQSKILPERKPLLTTEPSAVAFHPSLLRARTAAARRLHVRLSTRNPKEETRLRWQHEERLRVEEVEQRLRCCPVQRQHATQFVVPK